MPAPELYAVTGRPVAHSQSPGLFRLLFAAFGRDAVYTRLAADSAREALETAAAIGFRGLNVTSPFKEDVLPLVGRADEHAAAIGAANCLALAPGQAGGSSAAYNTDFIGLIGTLYFGGIDPAGRRALVLGTGGAARAAAYGLVRAKAARVVLASRSLDRARAVAGRLGCEGALLDDAPKMLESVDLCVSCLPFPASRVLPGPAPAGVSIVDAHYASSGPASGGGTRGGSTALRWLFHQAVPSFKIFTGLEVPRPLAQTIWDAFARLEPLPRPNIALVGFMGAGKTTVGRELARLLGRDFVDTDEIIEGRAGLGIPDIFARRGEASFRALEKTVISSLASSGGSPRIIAVGGGAVLDEANRAALARTCRVVWLWAPARTALARVEVATRPVLDPNHPTESAERTLTARIPLYASAADLVVDTALGDAARIARRITDEMG